MGSPSIGLPFAISVADLFFMKLPGNELCCLVQTSLDWVNEDKTFLVLFSHRITPLMRTRFTSSKAVLEYLYSSTM